MTHQPLPLEHIIKSHIQTGELCRHVDHERHFGFEPRTHVEHLAHAVLGQRRLVLGLRGRQQVQLVAALVLDQRLLQRAITLLHPASEFKKRIRSARTERMVEEVHWGGSSYPGSLTDLDDVDEVEDDTPFAAQVDVEVSHCRPAGQQGEG